MYKCKNNIAPSYSSELSHNIHQRVRFVPETSNFFKKQSQIAAGETDHLPLHLLAFLIIIIKKIKKKKNLLKTHFLSDTFSKV